MDAMAAIVCFPKIPKSNNRFTIGFPYFSKNHEHRLNPLQYEYDNQSHLAYWCT